ncbi:MAG: diguanylate cyclase [Alphaproteobacteria bacterium]|nr:diguanylate cyclase [Alphaproteobacteria bacterium]
MEHVDGPAQAKEYADTALGLMQQHEVPVTPINFEVWYTYASGRDPELNEAIDLLVSNGQPFTQEQNGAIAQQFVRAADTSEAVHEASLKIEESVNTVLGFLSEANDGATSYGEALESNLGEMANAENLESLRRAVETLVSDTKGMAAQNSLLQGRLEESSNEIHTLRVHLESVQKEAMTDALTGIANRKFFDTSLRQEAMAAIEGNGELCLLLGDIDHFKRFNDTYGHQVGDQVLKLVGMILKECATGSATAARYGGEEFAIVLPQSDLIEAESLAETVRTTVASKRIRKRSTGEDFGNITMSIGIALFRRGEPVTDLIQRADQSLYHAKNAGRNRVATERELESTPAA